VQTIRARKDDRGVILIALLWILMILSVIALSFARESFVDVAVARNTRDLADAYYIARAGIATTVYQLIQKTYLPQRTQQDLLALPVDPIDLGKVTGQYGDGEYEVEIQDESGKINLNFVTPAATEQLRTLMGIVGIQSPDADIILDSIIDWRDADAIPQPNGAEADFYQTLQPPYLPRNGNGTMSSLEELLLIRGVTPEYYYGRREKTDEGQIIERYGLSRYLTVYSPSNRININYAPLQVLLSIPGMSPAAAQAIHERRQVKPFDTIEEVTKLTGPSLETSALTFIYTQRSGVYTLSASAHRLNSRVRRVIRTTITLDPREPERYRIIYWNENIPNW